MALTKEQKVRAEFAKRMQQLRHDLGWPQEMAAEKIGVMRPMISNWEKGKNFPQLGTLIKIAAAYKRTPAFIAFGVSND